MDLKKKKKIKVKIRQKNVRMIYPKPISCIVSYIVLLFSLMLIMAVVYGIDILVATLANKFL
ncbi:MAG: hypothetical protein ACLVFD_01240 [Anaerostipes hadrus]